MLESQHCQFGVPAPVTGEPTALSMMNGQFKCSMFQTSFPNLNAFLKALVQLRLITGLCVALLQRAQKHHRSSASVKVKVLGDQELSLA